MTMTAMRDDPLTCRFLPWAVLGLNQWPLPCQFWPLPRQVSWAPASCGVERMQRAGLG